MSHLFYPFRFLVDLIYIQFLNTMSFMQYFHFMISVGIIRSFLPFELLPFFSSHGFWPNCLWPKLRILSFLGQILYGLNKIVEGVKAISAIFYAFSNCPVQLGLECFVQFAARLRPPPGIGHPPGVLLRHRHALHGDDFDRVESYSVRPTESAAARRVHPTDPAMHQKHADWAVWRGERQKGRRKSERTPEEVDGGEQVRLADRISGRMYEIGWLRYSSLMDKMGWSGYPGGWMRYQNYN